jgi:hypothetical protein
VAAHQARADSDEAYVLDLCDAILREPASRQHRFDWLVGDPGRNGRSRALPVDAYYAARRLVVECRERQQRPIERGVSSGQFAAQRRGVAQDRSARASTRALCSGVCSTASITPELLPALCPNESDRPEGRSQINDIAGEGLIAKPATAFRAWAVWDLAGKHWVYERIW